MKGKFLVITILILAICGSVFAQDDSDDEYKKNEVYVGYTGKLFDDVVDYEYQGGIQTSYVRNVDRYIGLKGEFATTKKNETIVRSNLGTAPNNFSVTTRNARRVTTLMGGVEIKDNKSKKTVVPFAHALAGVGNLSNTIETRCSQGNCPEAEIFDVSNSDTGFATSYGGGADIKITKNITFRPQADYSYIKLDGINRHNVRFGAGIVFKWN